MNILNGLEAVTDIVQKCIQKEMDEGILDDVNSLILVANNEEGVEEPAIWIHQHPTIPATNGKASLSSNIELSTTFEFVCIEYDPDPVLAEQKGQNLASRAVLSVMRNFSTIQSEVYNQRVIHNIEFNMFYPAGEVVIEGKREKVPATSVAVNVLHRIDWLTCYKKLKEEEQEETQNQNQNETENNNENDNGGE